MIRHLHIRRSIRLADDFNFLSRYCAQLCAYIDAFQYFNVTEMGRGRLVNLLKPRVRVIEISPDGGGAMKRGMVGRACGRGRSEDELVEIGMRIWRNLIKGKLLV